MNITKLKSGRAYLFEIPDAQKGNKFRFTYDQENDIDICYVLLILCGLYTVKVHVSLTLL